MTTYLIDIPSTFAIDHAERDLPTGEQVKVLARTIRYRCTAPELREWLSDAEYYSDCAGIGWSDPCIGLQASAQGTVGRIAKLFIAHGISRVGPVATNRHPYQNRLRRWRRILRASHIRR
mgnify:CR=1 FL=1